MADKPDKFPDWATTEEIDPTSGQANRVEPPVERKASGWTRQEIPPRQWWNWTLWAISRWIRWAEARIEAIEDPEQTEFLRKSENLSDLQNAATGRINLGVPYSSEAEALAGTAEDRVIAPARFGDNSLTTNGYQVLPGGLILQWGLQPFSGSGTQSATVTFPIEFPNAILSATVSHAQSTGTNPDSVYHEARTTTSMTVGITGDTSTDVMWQAIGH